MSWFERVKAKWSGTSASGTTDAAGDGTTEQARRREADARRNAERDITRLSEAIARLRDGAAKASLCLERGVAYKNLGDFARALNDFARVAEVVPALADVHAHRGECFLRRRDYARAVDSLDRAIALLPGGIGLATSYLNRGMAQAELGALDAAVADFARAVAAAPEAAAAAHEQQARIRPKLEARARELDPGPGADEVRTTAGCDPASNAASGGKAIHQSQDPHPLIAQAREREVAGDLVGALVAFSKAIDREPSPEVYWGRGIVNCKLARYVEAIADLDHVLERQPRNVSALTERGLAYAGSGDVTRALADYDAAIGIDPSYPLVHENRGLCYLRAKRWAEAVPCFDVALRLAPRNASLRYHRGIAHEMLGDLGRAMRDLQNSTRSAPREPHVAYATERLQGLRARARGVTESDQPDPAADWPVLTGVSTDDTVAELVRRVHAEGAFLVRIGLSGDDATVASIYGRYGLRRRLTEIADVIGPPILALTLGQFHDLLTVPPPKHAAQDRPVIAPRAPASDTTLLVEGERLHVLTDGPRVVSAFSEGSRYHALDLPTVLFGAQVVFGRSEAANGERRCSSCWRPVVYFDPTLEADKLTGYACPHCGASPISGWIEERMRPGRWSRGGFLGDTERLHDVIARDEEILERHGLRPAQVADALEQLLARASAASADRIVRAAARFEAELRASGAAGVAGLAVLPLGASLDDLERQLRNGDKLPVDRGTAIDDHDVYLQVYGAYQYCPFTIAHRPWSDDEPMRVLIRRLADGVAYVSEPLDRELPCGSELSYRYANLEFLIVHRATRQALRGAGLLVHLMRDHRFCEGHHSPYRLDPLQAARVLGLA